MDTYLKKACIAWEEDLPDWVDVLAQFCDNYSQRLAAAEIRYSPAVVTQVLKNTYNGNLTAIEDAVKGAFMHATVNCPVIGDLPTNNCLENQKKKFSTSNPQRVQLYRACRVCEHNRSNGER